MFTKNTTLFENRKSPARCRVPYGLPTSCRQAPTATKGHYSEGRQWCGVWEECYCITGIDIKYYMLKSSVVGRPYWSNRCFGVWWFGFNFVGKPKSEIKLFVKPSSACSSYQYNRESRYRHLFVGCCDQICQEMVLLPVDTCTWYQQTLSMQTPWRLTENLTANTRGHENTMYDTSIRGTK